jgi:hypothetical protein
MWFLGAGASVSAGVPTAWDMIWQFKQILYAAQRRVPLSTIADTGNPSVRALLDAHVSGSGSLPVPGAPDEYAALFEAAYPAEKDRRTFIDGMIGGAKPAYGHLALAALLKAGHAHLIWTTNPITSSRMPAQPMAPPSRSASWPLMRLIWQPSRLQRSNGLSSQAARRFPVPPAQEHTRRLRQQDAQLREVLVDPAADPVWSSGYSGRDASIMDALEAALERPGAFPGGLFWLHRGEEPPSNASTSCSNAPRRLASTAGWSVSRIWTKRFAISCVCCLTSTRQRSTAWVRSNAGGQPPRR